MPQLEQTHKEPLRLFVLFCFVLKLIAFMEISVETLAEQKLRLQQFRTENPGERGESDFQNYYLIIFENPVFNKKFKKHIKKQENIRKKINRQKLSLRKSRH